MIFGELAATPQEVVDTLDRQMDFIPLPDILEALAHSIRLTRTLGAHLHQMLRVHNILVAYTAISMQRAISEPARVQHEVRNAKSRLELPPKAPACHYDVAIALQRLGEARAAPERVKGAPGTSRADQVAPEATEKMDANQVITDPLRRGILTALLDIVPVFLRTEQYQVILRNPREDFSQHQPDRPRSVYHSIVFKDEERPSSTSQLHTVVLRKTHPQLGMCQCTTKQRSACLPIMNIDETCVSQHFSIHAPGIPTRVQLTV